MSEICRLVPGSPATQQSFRFDKGKERKPKARRAAVAVHAPSANDRERLAHSSPTQ